MFLSNNFVLPAMTIARLYKYRWKVELFLKWIKQHLRIRAARKLGRVLHLPDALIAATAKENGLTLATRNVCDFDYLGVAVVDPWALDPSAQ